MATCTALQGLSDEQAEQALLKYGKNEIPEEVVPLWKIYVKQFIGAMPFMIEV
jgi:magnesium-transporting ATPase (P-type)